MALEKALPISTSTPPDFPADQRNLFVEVLTLMNERGVPYVVSGAFALQQHTGIWRNTKDLDLFMAPCEVPRALDELGPRRIQDRDLRSSIALQSASRRLLRGHHYRHE